MVSFLGTSIIGISLYFIIEFMKFNELYMIQTYPNPTPSAISYIIFENIPNFSDIFDDSDF
jgi:hypothetical protein